MFHPDGAGACDSVRAQRAVAYPAAQGLDAQAGSVTRSGLCSVDALIARAVE